MPYHLLHQLVQQEGSQWARLDHVWRPTQLFYIQQVRALLSDIQGRYDQLVNASGEMGLLTYADRYAGLLKDMRLAVREAGFQWKANQLRFIRAVTRFYSAYGIVLRMLKNEESLGTFSDHKELKSKEGV